MSARRRLPDRRACESISAGHGLHGNSRALLRWHTRRDFLSNRKAGSAADAAARDSAVVCSLALQHGVPVETIRRALLRDPRGEPSSPLGKALDLLTESSS
jgi:hypothetical protein